MALVADDALLPVKEETSIGLIASDDDEDDDLEDKTLRKPLVDVAMGI